MAGLFGPALASCSEPRMSVGLLNCGNHPGIAARAAKRPILDAFIRSIASNSFRLIEYHHLGDEGLDVSDVLQTTTRGERSKILVAIACIIWLVIILRKEF